MEKLKILFENCYGIKKLEHEFDFSDRSVFSLYAPNGTMKTSFARTFKDFSLGKSSTDLIFQSRTNTRIIQNENGDDLDKNQVFVIEPYIESYKSERLSTLLVNQTLKDKYEEILKQIESEKSSLVSKLKQLSGLTGRNITVESELSKIFGQKSIFDVLIKLEELINEREEHPFSSVIYSKIFDDKVVEFLNTKNFKKQIKDYIERYNTLIESSKYLKKGFNHTNATEIHKALKGNGFFGAKHSVNLFNGSSSETISSESELLEIIQKEIDSVLNDSEIQKMFNEIDGKLKNVQLKEFREYIFDNKFLLPELNNLGNLQKEIWYSYLVEQKELVRKLLEEYKKGKAEIETIVEKAKEQETEWKTVISIFNQRFTVPFDLIMENQDDVILKSEAPNLKFIFKDVDNEESQNVDEKELLNVLSQGERRALYLLNIIFEVRAREKENQDTVFIVDDIADSFDYKNKYAIIEYLKEISENELFNQIILTHNFDFHRTVSSRLDMGRQNKLNSVKTENEIKIVQEKYQGNPFTYWKSQLALQDEMMIATIPFVRNLAEYAGYDTEFLQLTSLLHYKEDTASLKVSDLEIVFKSVLKDKADLSLPNQDKIVKDLIFELADDVYSNTSEVLELESKILLSIAIRLISEIYMVEKIADDEFWKSIPKNQTFVLIKKFAEKFPDKTEELELLEQINLMTPENIHLNSFMYEPILDMSNNHLKKLYNDSKTRLN